MNPVLRIEIIKMLAEGKNTRHIAQVSGYPFSTIETYRVRLLREMGAKNTPHLINKAYQQGILKIQDTK